MRSSYFVVDVGRTLRRHLLDYVDGVSVIPADLLIVRAVGRVRGPQWDDDVTRLRAVVVGAGEGAPSSSFGAGQRGQGQRRVVCVRVLRVSASVANHTDDSGDQQKEGRPPCSSCDHSDVRSWKRTVPSILQGPSGLSAVP